MLKMFRYIKERWYYLILIFALLFLQAYCELSLPDYTSKIVNVGIQQQGIEDNVADELSEASMKHLLMFMTEEEQAQVSAAYEQSGENYSLRTINNEEREALNTTLARPMMIVAMLGGDSEEAAAMKTQMGLPEGTDFFTVLEAMPQSQRDQVIAGINESLAATSDTIISQAAISFVGQEYTALGRDVGEIQMHYVLMSGLRMLGLALVSMLAAIMVTFLSCQVAAGLSRNLRNAVYRRVISFSGAELNQFSTASLITRSTNDIQQIQMLMTMLFRIVLYAPILAIGGILKVVGTDASMSWILALGVGLILLLVLLLFSVAMPKFKLLQTLIDRLNLVTREILTGIPVIRAFSREKHEEKRFDNANRDLTKTNLFVNRCMTFMMPVMMLIMNGITVLIIFNGSHAVDNGTMQVGNMMAFMQYAMQIIMSFLMMTMLSIMLPRAAVSANRINEVLETDISIENPEAPKTPVADEKGLVEFDHVGFKYPDAKESVLSDITFKAKKGQTVAFIGSTGSGKSTLINLIPRFFDVTEGCIKVDGVDIREMSLKDLRDRIGYVPQKGVLFSGTIETNLRYGAEDARSEEIEQAAKVAQAWEFISEKQDGIEAAIAQGGTNVSGGQKQRLSIARAIAKKPEIYIFDDSFSALDYKTDVVLRRALKQETQDATTLIVAQRISTILHADHIIVLDNGRIAGQGTHQELLKTCDVYKQIAMSQLSEEELANE